MDNHTTNPVASWVKQAELSTGMLQAHFEEPDTARERLIIVDTLKLAESLHCLNSFIQEGTIQITNLPLSVVGTYSKYFAQVMPDNVDPAAHACQHLEQATSQNKSFLQFLSNDKLGELLGVPRITAFVARTLAWYRSTCSFAKPLTQWVQVDSLSVIEDTVLSAVSNYLISVVDLYSHLTGWQEGAQAFEDKELDLVFLQTLKGFVEPDIILGRAFSRVLEAHNIHKATKFLEDTHSWIQAELKLACEPAVGQVSVTGGSDDA